MHLKCSISLIVVSMLLVGSWILSKIYYKNARLYNPFMVFYGVWFLNLICYELDQKYHFFKIRLSFETDLWMSIALISFFVGGLLAFAIRMKPQSNNLVSGISHRLLWLITYALFTLFVIAVSWKYYQCYRVYGEPMHALHLIRGDTVSGIFSYPFFLYLFTLPSYLLIANLGILLAMEKSKKAVTLSIITLTLIYVNSMLVGARGGFVNAFLLFIATILLANVFLGRVITKRHFLWIGSFVVSLLFLIALSLHYRSSDSIDIVNNLTLYMDKWMESNTKNYMSVAPQDLKIDLQSDEKSNKSSLKSSLLAQKKSNDVIKQNDMVQLTDYGDISTQHFSLLMKIGGRLVVNNALPIADAFFEHNFLYFVGTIPSYSYFMSHPWSHRYWGMWSFLGVYQSINLLAAKAGYNLFPELKNDVVSYYAPVTMQGPYNSTNYLIYLFSDFGYKGLIIVPMLFGFIANFFFIRMMKYHSMLSVHLSSVIFLGLILSVHGLIINSVFFWIFIMLAIFQYWIIARSHQSPNGAS